MSDPLRERLRALVRGLTRARHPAPDALTQRDTPVSRVFGLDRGTPIDRHYIEAFLRGHGDLIRGRTLEVGERRYTTGIGGPRVETAEVLLMAEDGQPNVVAGDLSHPGSLPERHSDCFVCTQTLNFIFDVGAAVESAHRVLKPGGVLLATVAGISQISRYDMDRWGDYWRFTTASLEKLLAPVFRGGVEVKSHGNVLAATAFLHGLAVEDLPDRARLDAHDPDYQLIVTAVARRAS
jgi:SAM-dependent methyltransferase